MNKRMFRFLLICGTMFSFFSCDKVTEMLGKKNVETVQAVVAVCINDMTMLYSDTTLDGDPIAILALGETVSWTGDSNMVFESTVLENTVLDSTVKLIRVKLADSSTIGWVDERFIVRGAVTGAAKKQTKLYNRPDTLTITENKLDFMDMVAVTTVSNEWYQVIGENKEISGWVRKDDIITEKQEVVSAIYARIKLREENEFNRMQKMDYIILNAPFENSYFIEEVKKLKALEEIFKIPTTTDIENGIIGF